MTDFEKLLDEIAAQAVRNAGPSPRGFAHDVVSGVHVDVMACRRTVGSTAMRSIFYLDSKRVSRAAVLQRLQDTLRGTRVSL